MLVKKQPNIIMKQAQNQPKLLQTSPKFAINPFRRIAPTCLTKLCNSITRQWLELERCSNHLRIRGWTGSGLPESTPKGFSVFLSDPDLESKIYEKPDPESLFNFDSSRSLCGHSLSKNMGKLRLD